MRSRIGAWPWSPAPALIFFFKGKKKANVVHCHHVVSQLGLRAAGTTPAPAPLPGAQAQVSGRRSKSGKEIATLLKCALLPRMPCQNCVDCFRHSTIQHGAKPHGTLETGHQNWKKKTKWAEKVFHTYLFYLINNQTFLLTKIKQIQRRSVDQYVIASLFMFMILWL